DVDVIGEIFLVRLLQRTPATAERERPEGGAVVGLLRPEHPPTLRRATLDVIGPRQPDRRFVRFRAARRELHPSHLGSHLGHQPLRQLLLRTIGEVVVVVVGDFICLGGGGVDHLHYAIAKTAGHGSAGARIQDPPSVGGEEPYAFAALDARVGKIEEPRKDGCLFGADGGRHVVTGRMLIPATFSRYPLSNRSAFGRAVAARRLVSSSSASGSTPSASSSCR